MVRSLINKLFKNNIHDILTGYRAFSYKFVKSIPILSTGFELETEMSIHAIDKNMNLKEIPVQYRDRPQESKSKLNTYTDGVKVLKTIAMLFKEFKPGAFFYSIAIIFFIISIIFAAPVYIEYFQTGLVPRIPTLIVSGFFMMVSLLMMVTGLILNVIVKKHRQLYELQLNQICMIKDK